MRSAKCLTLQSEEALQLTDIAVLRPYRFFQRYDTTMTVICFILEPVSLRLQIRGPVG